MAFHRVTDQREPFAYPEKLTSGRKLKGNSKGVIEERLIKLIFARYE